MTEEQKLKKWMWMMEWCRSRKRDAHKPSNWFAAEHAWVGAHPNRRPIKKGEPSTAHEGAVWKAKYEKANKERVAALEKAEEERAYSRRIESQSAEIVKEVHALRKERDELKERSEKFHALITKLQKLNFLRINHEEKKVQWNLYPNSKPSEDSWVDMGSKYEDQKELAIVNWERMAKLQEEQCDQAIERAEKAEKVLEDVKRWRDQRIQASDHQIKTLTKERDELLENLEALDKDNACLIQSEDELRKERDEWKRACEEATDGVELSLKTAYERRDEWRDAAIFMFVVCLILIGLNLLR